MGYNKKYRSFGNSVINIIFLIIFILASVSLLYFFKNEMISDVTVTVVDDSDVPQSGYSVSFTPLDSNQLMTLVAYYTNKNGQYHGNLHYGEWRLDVSCSDLFRSCKYDNHEVRVIKVDQSVTNIVIKVDS